MYAKHVYNFLRTIQNTSTTGLKSRVTMRSLLLAQGDLEPKGLEREGSGGFLMPGHCCSCDLAGALLCPIRLRGRVRENESRSKPSMSRAKQAEGTNTGQHTQEATLPSVATLSTPPCPQTCCNLVLVCRGTLETLTENPAAVSSESPP